MSEEYDCDAYYCFDCKKYFKGKCLSPNGFNTCNECDKMNIITLIKDYDNSLCIEEQAELCMNVGDLEKTREYLKIMENLINGVKEGVSA